jgi:hypothetical protein
MAETKTVNLNVETNLGSLKSQLKEAQRDVETLSEKFGATSDAAILAARKAGELKDAIGDAKALTDAFNPDAKFNALSSSLSGVASGFSAYQGAMGLVGVESKAIEEQLLKVQSAMALAQGLQGLGEARDSFKQLKAVALDAFKGIKTAIGATGIGLLVVALGAIYTYWDDIKAAVSGVSEEQKKLTIQVHKDTLLQQEKLDKLDSQNNILKLQGKSERDILKLKIAQTDEVIKKSEIELENSIQTRKTQVIAEQKNKEILKSAIDFIAKPLLLVLGTVDKIGSFLGKKWTLGEDLKEWSANLIFDPKKVKDEGLAVEKEMRDNLDKLKNNRAGYLLQIKDLDKQEVTSNKDKLKTQKEDKSANDKEDKESLAKQQKELNDEKLRLQKEQFDREDEQFKLHQEATYTEQELEIAKLQEQYDAKFAIANGNAELEKELEQAQKDELAAINDKYRLAEKDKQDEIDKKKLEADKILQSQKIDAVQSTLSTIGNLAELFAGKSRKQQETAFKIQKAVNIANATIDTYKAATGAYSSLAAIPVIGPGLGIAAAGLAISAGLLNVKKIASTKFDSGGGGSTPPSGAGGGGGGGGTVITPNFNIVGSNGTNQLQQLKQAPIQAYVVSGEMSTQQSLDRNRLRNATL